MSVVLAARAEVEGLGGREARKSPYAGPSWSLRSADNIVRVTDVDGRVMGRRWSWGERLTINRFALRHVGIVGARQQAVPVSTDDTLDVAVDGMIST